MYNKFWMMIYSSFLWHSVALGMQNLSQIYLTFPKHVHVHMYTCNRCTMTDNEQSGPIYHISRVATHIQRCIVSSMNASKHFSWIKWNQTHWLGLLDRGWLGSRRVVSRGLSFWPGSLWFGPSVALGASVITMSRRVLRPIGLGIASLTTPPCKNHTQTWTLGKLYYLSYYQHSCAWMISPWQVSPTW